MDYPRLIGVDGLAKAAHRGSGVKVAVIDSGCPVPCCFPACFAWGPKDDLDDNFGHATAIASILFGGRGICGMCESAYPCYFKVLDDKGSGTIRSVSDGINEAVDRNVDVINLSLGFFRTKKCPKALKEACERAYEAKIPIFCAAGNDGGPVNWPGALKTTICIGSAAQNGLKMPFSSTGEVDFVAPGHELEIIDKAGRRTTVSGTSYSTAIVTGVAALLMPEIKASDPNFSVESVKSALKAIVRDVDAPGWDKNTGYGLISGKENDTTVCMETNQGFFDRILCKVRDFLGLDALDKQGDNNGRV